ncbi:OAS-TL4 cysteine synthase [Trifolium pratense]|uniref:OAS-TL4 cysteine synthase n=1 Tax=Trifolium pratense TaxID=57577 RepID=A0A2K3M909_TRIPR|nr:OAS-TL4 cysteine synthase [Trifolium pratense]
MVEAYIAVLKSLAGEKLLITEAQLCAIAFLGTVMSLLTCLQWHSSGHEPIIELSRRLLSVQKDLGLRWEPGLSTQLEHDGLSMTIHFETTRPEIWVDTMSNVDVLVAAIGTGGTITGTGDYLRMINRKIQV